MKIDGFWWNLIDFAPKFNENWWKSIKIWSFFAPKLIDFWSIFAQKLMDLASKFYENPFKNRFQEPSEKWSIFGPIFCPSWLHVGTQVGTQEPLKTVPKRPQDAPKTPPRQPKSHKSTQDRNLVHFWSQSPMGYPPRPRFSMFLARLNSNFGAKVALGNLESFTSDFKIQKVNS